MMGQINTKINEYMRNHSRFADVFNYYLYDGKPVIKPDSLRELALDNIASPLVMDVFGEAAREAFFNILAMKDENVVYMLFNVWEQAGTDYAAAIKDLLSAASQYDCQLEEMNEDGKLLPVINLVLYWSPKSWDGAESIHEMLKINDRQILQFIPNYSINLLAPYEMDEEDFGKFQTSLAECLQFVKNSDDMAHIRRILEKNPKFRHLEKPAAEIINTITWEKLLSDHDIHEIDMYAALTSILFGDAK